MFSAKPSAPVAPKRPEKRATAAPRPAGRALLSCVLLGVVLGAGLAACGQVGPLYQPPAEPQSEPTDPPES